MSRDNKGGGKPRWMGLVPQRAKHALSRRSESPLFWQHVRKDPDGCWIWTGPTDAAGVPVFAGERAATIAHGKSGAGYAVPVCGNPLCVKAEQRSNRRARARGNHLEWRSPEPKP